MFKTWLGFLATCGVAVATLFTGQLGKAADDVARNPAVSNALGAPVSAADSREEKNFLRTKPAGSGSAAEVATPLTVLTSGPNHVRIIYRAKAGPVLDLDRTLKQLFHLEGELSKSGGTSAKGGLVAGVAIAPSKVNNSFVISGPPAAVEEVRGLLDKLDQPMGLILLEMEIGEAPVGAASSTASSTPAGKSPGAAVEPFRLLQRPANMETTGRVRLITMDNQPAFAQMGARVPRVKDVSGSPTSGQKSSISLENVGLILGVTPRISPDGTVVMEIDAEQSQAGPENEGVPISVAGDKVIRSPRIDVTTVQTTVTIPNGQTIILASVARQSKAGKELVIIVTPHILGLEEAKKTR
jgi:type II secretory pathway component GspD/PulD (secretin)